MLCMVFLEPLAFVVMDGLQVDILILPVRTSLSSMLQTSTLPTMTIAGTASPYVA